jgi:hypothetical protein
MSTLLWFPRKLNRIIDWIIADYKRVQILFWITLLQPIVQKEIERWITG